jgi:hypothetical protein
MRTLTKLFVPALLLSLGAAATAGERFAAGGNRHGVPMGQLLVAQNDGPSLNDAVEQVRRQYNGRIVSAETRVSGNREVHHIKVLTEDGKVKTVRIPGRTRRS